MKTERIRFFALLLAVLLMVAMLPVTAFAAEEDDWDSDFYLQSYSIPGTSSKTVVRPGNTFTLKLVFHVTLPQDPEDPEYLEDLDTYIDNLQQSSLILDNGNFKETSGSVVYSFKEAQKVSPDKNLYLDTENSTFTVSLSLKANSSLETSTLQYPFSVKLYKGTEDDPTTLSFSSVYISVNKPVIGTDDDESEDEDETDPILTPHLVITSVSTAGQQLPTDEDFTVTISF
ncbi:MAG TPA: hypothetical protein PLU75_04565 [Oscillospiraceae bacterium]|nr:hypothetical protein [Oscillospiraceae bacterium]HRW57255.1 hypothetical protein [Oscillospiraceae bacterium]